MRTLLLTALFVAGCASASDAYRSGMERETAGDYASAADSYVTSLERDGSLPNVRGRLEVAGREAVRRAITRAGTLDPEGAAQAWLDADALVRRAAGVGVDLERRPTFDADRDAALALAVEDLHDRADAALASGDFAGSIDRLNRARAFRPTATEAAALDQTAVEAYRQWGAADLGAGRFRAALSRADAALAVAEDDDLLDLRAAVLDAGTVLVAVLPAESDDAPEAFLRDLADVVVEESLAPPPLFVALADPAEVRRWERAQRGRRGPALADAPRRVGDAAADLGVDLAFVVSLGPLVEAETAGEPVRQRAETRAGAPATYTTRDVELTLSARGRVVGVEAGSQRDACDAPVRASVEEPYVRAGYDGDWRTLDLPRAARAGFADDVDDQAYARALDRLRDALAAEVAEAVAACAGRQVP